VARRLRIQYPGAIYHVINRGNYRRDVFETVGAAKAFESALDEVCETFRWGIHGYVVMRNHYHLAVQTPEPNLVEGMHWLQTTFATRFNRFRSERGHLFQGRYQALLVENFGALARVVNYIHLNPIRAGVVSAEQAAQFRWSSLNRFTRSDRPAWLTAEDWMLQLGYEVSRDGFQAYAESLKHLVTKTTADEDEKELCTGWAIGTHGWRAAVAKDHAHLAIHPGMDAEELRDLKHARWAKVLQLALAESGMSLDRVLTDAKGADWKCELAERLRKEASASHEWIARTLHMGSVNSVRSHLSRRRGAKVKNQQLSA
jgi:putative transposase